MRRRRLFSSATLALPAAILLSGPCLLAQDQSAPRAPKVLLHDIQRIAVPEDNPKQWPFRDQTWIEVNREDYLRRLSRLLSPVDRPNRPIWQRVRYTAVLTGDTLTSGRLTAELSDLESRPRFLTLGNPSLAIEELSWSGDLAIWGTDLHGKHWLEGNAQARQLEGRWSARGRPLEAGAAFELSLLSATVSELDLQIPAGQVLASDVGDVELTSSGPTPEWQTWRISLGDHSRCRLIVSQPARAGLPIPTMLYEQEQAVNVGQEELQVAQTFLVELLGGGVSRFTVSMPRAVEIVSASSAEQLPLAFERIPGEGPSSQIVVMFPEDAAGRRSFRLDGFVRRAPGEQFAVPQFVLEGGLWRNGRVNVTIGRPMELRSYRCPGYRQSAPVSSPAEGEMISFQQILPRAQLLLNVERPNIERSAHAINKLEVGLQQWTLTAEIAWQSRAGAAFDASCRIPDGFRVLSVVKLRGGAEAQELVDWTLESHPNSGHVLTLEFPDGLTPGRVESIRITTQRDVTAHREPRSVPLMTPIDCEFAEVLLWIDKQSERRLALTSSDQFEPFDLRSPANVWNTLPAWLAVWDKSGEEGVLLHMIHPELSVPVATPDRTLTGPAAADLLVTLGETHIHERYEVHLDGHTKHARTVELGFAESTPGIRWTAQSAPDQELSVQRRSATNGESDETGEISVISLPSREGDGERLIGTREIPWTGHYSVPVMLAPRNRSFSGRVRLVSESAISYLLATQVSAEGEQGPAQVSITEVVISGPLEWTYHDAKTAWRVRSRDRLPAKSGHWAYRLRSVLSGESPGYDHHELRISPATKIESEGLRFQLSPSAELLAAWSDDRTLNLKHDGEAWTIVGGGPISDRNELVLTYRTSTAAQFGSLRHQLEVPQLPGACSSFTWQIGAADHVTFRSPPLGLAMTPAPFQPDWWQRLRGPLSQFPGDAEDRQSGVRPAASSASDLKTGPWKISFPENAVVYELSSPESPRAAQFTTWDNATLRLTTWICLAGCLPVGWWFRKSSGVWRNQVLSLLLGIAACLAVFGPDGWSEFSGGIFSGLVISLLLPGGSWKFGQPTVPQISDRSASTEIFRRAAVPFVLWLAVSPAAPWSFAQSDAGSSEKSADNREKNYRVLMPVDENQRPSESLPFVYVSSDLNDALNSAPIEEDSGPGQLIASAEYLLYEDQNRRPMLRVQYDVVRFGEAPSPALQIPLAPVWRRNLESCLVDGQTQSATTSEDENSLVIPLPADLGGRDGVSRYVVRLEIPLPQSMNPQSEALQGAIFPALNSRLSWQSPEALGHVQFPSTRGSLSVSLDRRLLEAQLGDIHELSLRQSTAELPNSEGRTELHLLQIVMLRPMMTQVTFRSECRVLDGSVNRLELDLPPGGVLRDLRAHHELQRSVVPSPDGGSRAVIEFSEPQKQDFVVEGEYVLPRSSMDEAVDLPRLQVRSGTSGPARQTVAVACPAEFTAQLINLDDPAVLPILVDAFFTLWGDTFPNQRPQFAFQVQEGARPSFRLSPVQSDQQVVTWHENAIFSRKGLEWELRAEIRSTAWPVHSFTVLLDRRLTLDTVTVTDDGGDLLARVTKTPMIGSSQNRLTMLLSREAAGNCQVRIHGAIRFRPASSLMLPTARFETPQSVPGTLALYHETGYRLQLEGKPMELATPVPAGSLLPEQPHLELFRQFKLTEGDTGLTARLEPVSGSCTVQTLWLVNAEAKNWRVRGWMELTPEDGTREVRIILPDWLRRVDITASPGESLPQEDIRDGQTVLTMVCSGRESTPQLLQWDVSLPESDRSAISLKLPIVPQASQYNDLAAIASTDGRILSGKSVLSVNEMPAVVREQLTQWQAASLESLTQLSNHLLSAQRVDAKSPDGRLSVVLIEHLLSCADDGTWLGESTFYPSESAEVVDVLLPENLEIIARLTDRTFVPPEDLSDEGRLWRIAEAGQFRRLTVRWKSPMAANPNALSGLMTLQLPECRQERHSTTYVGILGSSSTWTMLPRNLQRRSGASLAMEVLQTEIQRYQNSTENGEADTAAGQRIWKLYRAASEQLVGARSFELLSDDDLRRWDSVVQFVNQIGKDSTTPDDPTFPAEFEFRSSAEANFGVLRGDAAELNYWLVRRSLVAGVGGVWLMLVGIWLLPKLTRWLLSPAWAQHRQAAWLLFGVVWWICWSPKIVALAMVAWSFAEWVQHRRSRLAVIGQ